MKKCVLFLFVTVFYACQDVEENKYEIIDLRNAFAHLAELSVKDLGDRISYVPLETTDESLIGKQAYVRIFKDKLVVGSFQQPVKMFDKKTGTFIRTVGAIGQGVNEYTLQDDIPVFWIDDVKGILYIKNTGERILRFDAEGNYLDSISLPENLMYESSRFTTGDKMYIYKPTLFNKSDYKVSLYDIEKQDILQTYFWDEEEVIPFESVSTLLVSPRFNKNSISPTTLIYLFADGRVILQNNENPCLWGYDNEVYFKENFNDTIYHMGSTHYKPRLIFDLGERHWPYEERYKMEGNENKIAINYLLEGKKSIFFVFQTDYQLLDNAKTYLGVYNKDDKSVKVTDKVRIKDPANGFFDGMLQTATPDGQLAGLIEAYSFMEDMNGENTLKISEEDNPIVVIIE